VSAAPRLAELQSVLLRLLRAPEGVATALAELSAAGDPAAGAVEGWIAGDERMGAAERLDVYADMYFYRLKDVLAEEFARTAGLLGEARFHNLVTDFLLEHPSRSPSIRWLSRPLPAFLARHALAEEFPAAPDLAALEWAWWDAFQAPDAEPLSAERIAAVPEERWGSLVLRTAPSFHLLRVRRESLAIFREGSAKEAPGPAAVAVVRPALAPFVEELGDREAGALDRIAAGEPIGDVASGLAGEALDEEQTIEGVVELASYLKRWIEAGYFAAALS
jgi:hypothetical protein